MVCPDCQTKAMSFAEYCKKCGAQLIREKGRRNQKNILYWTF